ncbi:MAG: protein-L-isoaspartate(D-aspartate) O-methyltransferase [Ignavibacteria bacterium]|nr:protein-L-isoaspartate(D-aspartate) O-methyltransferase [Ignavibacteria bacterium]
MFESERENLVHTLMKKGIKAPQVLDAFYKVERHLFVPESMKFFAYKDNALPIGKGQTISQPYTVAYMTEKLDLQKGDRVLEIGTGSGFQAAILYAMGMKVYTIERQYDIFLQTQKLFERLQVRVMAIYGDGTIGWTEFAPYQGIIVTAGSPKVPDSLLRQLAVGGKMVIPVGTKSSQELHIITRLDEEHFELKKEPNFLFVPLIGREGWDNE